MASRRASGINSRPLARQPCRRYSNPDLTNRSRAHNPNRLEPTEIFADPKPDTNPYFNDTLAPGGTDNNLNFDPRSA